jgi:glycosyltransferase involved in cell wall biosynthesis
MRLTLINQFDRPDIAPTAQLAASLAEHRAALGDDVTVVTGRGRYVSGAASATAADRNPRVPSPASNPRIRPVWTPSLGKATIVKRLFDYLCFYLGALWRLATLPRQDVIISLTTPPYIAWAGALHKLLHPSTKLVLWNMDCYPDAVERAGLIRRAGIVSRILRAMNRSLFRRVDTLVGLDTAMIDLLTSQYAPSADRPPTRIIPNWEDLSFFPREPNPPRWADPESLGLAGKFVVRYLGNAGTGHAFETVLDAAERFRGEPVAFLFVGGGSRTASIRDAKQRRGLDNVVLREYVHKDLTPSIMNTAGCALITLRDEALGVMSPSKLHSNLAMGLPVLYVGPERSNVDDAIRRFGCGVSLRHGDVAGVETFVRRLACDADERGRMRRLARQAFEEAYCDARTLPQFDDLLATLLARCPQPAPAATSPAAP